MPTIWMEFSDNFLGGGGGGGGGGQQIKTLR